MSQLLQGIAVVGSMDPNVINKHYKLELLAKFNEARLANPRLNAEELARMIGSSSSTLNRIRRDLAICSPYRYDVPIVQSKSKKKSDEENKEEKPKKTRGRKKKSENADKSETIQLTNNRTRSKTPNKKEYGGAGEDQILSKEELAAKIFKEMNPEKVVTDFAY